MGPEWFKPQTQQQCKASAVPEVYSFSWKPITPKAKPELDAAKGAGAGASAHPVTGHMIVRRLDTSYVE